MYWIDVLVPWTEYAFFPKEPVKAANNGSEMLRKLNLFKEHVQSFENALDLIMTDSVATNTNNTKTFLLIFYDRYSSHWSLRMKAELTLIQITPYKRLIVQQILEIKFILLVRFINLNIQPLASLAALNSKKTQKTSNTKQWPFVSHRKNLPAAMW